MFYSLTNEYFVILKEDVAELIVRVSEKDSLSHDASLYQNGYEHIHHRYRICIRSYRTKILSWVLKYKQSGGYSFIGVVSFSIKKGGFMATGFIYNGKSTKNIIPSSELLLATFDGNDSITGHQRDNIIGETTISEDG